MRREITHIVVGTNIEDEEPLSLRQLCRACAVHAEAILAMIDEGILEPRGEDASTWRFPIHSIRRARRAVRIQEDLGVNLAGAALALDLLDRVEALERQLRQLGMHHVSHHGSDQET